MTKADIVNEITKNTGIDKVTVLTTVHFPSIPSPRMPDVFRKINQQGAGGQTGKQGDADGNGR